MLSASKGVNVKGSANNRVGVTCKPTRAVRQRLTALGLEPATTQARLAIVLRAAVIGIAVVLHTLSASAQSAKDVKGPTPLVAIQNQAPAKLIVDPPIPEQLASRIRKRGNTRFCAHCPANRTDVGR
jgi:hypothetical protein